MYSACVRASSGMQRNRGQAAVFVLLTLAVVLLGGLLLFNSGMAVNQKMKLQNAADATAFSVSQLEARDLNFTAYINRAMVAQEVAIAQMVGLASWAAYIATIPDYFSFYLQPVVRALQAGSLGILTPIATLVTTTINTARSIARSIKRVLGRIVGKVAAVLSGMNFVYSAAQLGMHLATAVMTVGMIDQLIQTNAPDARLSTFGVFALAAHMGTYYALSPVGFVQSYSQRGKSVSQKAGMHRLAATVQESRDPFSERREGSPWNSSEDPGWTLPIIPEINVDIDLLLLRVKLDFGLGVTRRGGTELRYRSRRRRESYSWTGADLLSVALKFAFRLSIPPLGIDLDLDLGENGPAFGVGGAIAAKRRQGPGVRGSLPELIGGAIPQDAYGEAAANAVSWVGTPLPNGGIPRFWRTNKVARRYPGLPRYNNISPPDSLLADFVAPNLMIGLTKKTRDAGMREEDGEFLKIDNAAANNELGVLAKSQVYFSRPNDLDYFRRDDGLKEKGNGFNPYWQAHLVDTSTVDRIIALGIQQQVAWVPQFNPPTSVPQLTFGQLLKKAGL